MANKTLRGICCVLVVILLSCLPVPEGLSSSAWLYTALYVGVLLGMVLEPVPPPLVGVLGLVVACLLRLGAPGSFATVWVGILPLGDVSSTMATRWAFSGFAEPAVWFLFIMMLLGGAFEATGLGKRMGAWVFRRCGQSALGLGYAVALTDAVLAPFMTSAATRSAGFVYPLVMGIAPQAGSFPEQEPRRLGAYLVWVGFASSCVTSSLFLTAYLPNLVALDVLRSSAVLTKLGMHDVGWTTWLMTVAPAGILLLLLTPLLTLWLYPPTMKRFDMQRTLQALTGGIPQDVQQRRRQTLLAILAVLGLALWIGGERLGLSNVMVSLLIFCLLIVFRVMSWQEVMAQYKAWGTFIWVGTLLSLNRGLIDMNIMDWIVRGLVDMGAFTPTMLLLAFVTVFFVSQYCFMGSMTQAMMLLPLFLNVFASAVGAFGDSAPIGQELIIVLALVLPVLMGFMGILTPYGSGQGFVWFASGYVTAGEFWFLGMLFGIIYLATHLFITIPWVMLGGFF